MSTVLMHTGTLELELQGESTVAGNAWYADSLLRFSDGSLLARAQTWRKPTPDGAATCQRVSWDQGDTWHPCPASAAQDHGRAAIPFIGRRQDGSLIGWSGAWTIDRSGRGRPGRPDSQSIVRAPSLEALAQGQGVTTEAAVHVPYLVPGTGDDLSEPPSYFVGNWGQMVEAEHGYLLQAAYSFLAYDRAPRLWQNQAAPACQYRTYTLYSQDDGASWHYLSTIAASGLYPLPAQAEGFCEPDLLHLGAGRLLCVMRTGGNPAGTHMERYTPLAACHSEDGGLTWTSPALVAPFGVSPILLQMADGLVVCLSGRPGFFLTFSADGGRTWSPPHWLTESHGAWGTCSSGYGRLIEPEPGVLGVAYDEPAADGDGTQMTVKYRRYRLVRTP